MPSPVPGPRRAATIAIAAAAFAASAAPAGAEPRSITVTLFGGQTITITVDVPPGTPLDQIVLPAVDTPIVAIQDGGPVVAPPAAPGPLTPVAEPEATRRPKHPKRRAKRKAKRRIAAAPPVRRAAPRNAKPKGVQAPSPANPTFTFAIPGPAPIGVPNVLIDRFRIPPFLLPIYQAAGIEHGVRWEILAAINEIETDYGRNLNVSSAGAQGWMQFMPATWKRYGTDANGDGERDPYNPVDAIFAAARYLEAAGIERDLRKAIFAYNHADWYVDSVLMRARLIAGLPPELIGSLTGLTEGRFPLAAAATYVRGSAAGLHIHARRGAAAVAVQDAKVVKRGTRRKLGRFIQLRDAYGNTYTYGHLAAVAKTYAVAGRRKDGTDSAAASLSLLLDAAAPVKERLHANRPAPRPAAPPLLRSLAVGARVPAGTVLGRIAAARRGSSRGWLRFEIRPVGKGSPRIDPKPILDGWKLLEATALYRARGKNPLTGGAPNAGQLLLMSKAQLMQRVLDDRRIRLHPGGRDDIASGQIDRRVLATLAFLAASGLEPTVTSLKSNHSLLTAGGRVSAHSTGNAVDIGAVNGIPIAGHQGAGSITDIAIRRLLTLQGTVKPAQIISLMSYAATDNTLSLPDHADHIHIGFRSEAATVLEPLQWTRLVDRLSEIDNPAVNTRQPRLGALGQTPIRTAEGRG